MMSPGINGGRGGGGSRHTGTVPKVKCQNHNEVVHDVVHHHVASGAAHYSGSLLLCGNSNGQPASLPSLQRRDFSFSHMNNNLGLSMDWQSSISDVVPVQQSGGMTRVRKESNTCSAGQPYDVAGPPTTDTGSGPINGTGNLSSSVAVQGIGSGAVAVDNINPGLLHDMPVRISNFTGSDNDELNQLRWDLDGSVCSANNNGNVVVATGRRQQKSNNLSEQAQVASRLQQIRDYIGQTSSVMERLQAAGTPQHMEIWLRLHDMLDGLRDSEYKLTTIHNTFIKLQALEETLDNNNTDDVDDNDDDDDENEDSSADSVPKSSDAMTRRNELKVKVEESQRKLVELREQQAALLALKQKAQEQLKEARAEQGALLANQNQEQRDNTITVIPDCNRLEERIQCLQNFYETQNELAHVVGCSGDDSFGEVVQLQNKLEELQTKKMQINQMVSRFDTSSSNSVPTPNVASIKESGVNNSGAVSNTGGNYSNSTNNIRNNTSSNTSSNNDGDGHVQTTEEKIAELSALKEQLARMQNALLNLSKSKPPSASHTSLSSNSNSSSVLDSATSHNTNSQEFEGGFQDNSEEPLSNVHSSSSINFKQDNREQAISQNQNHHQRQSIQQQQMHAEGSVSAPVALLSSGGGGGNVERVVTPTAVVQQQLHAKSLKLQEAKARLHHLQELLRLVEELREAGKPVPEQILMLLNSPNGPLSSDDSLDLEPQPKIEVQNRYSCQQVQSCSSSSSSSLVSLFQPQINNNDSGSVSACNTSTGSTITRVRDTQQSSANRSSDISSIQNLNQQPSASASNVAPTLRQLPQQPPVVIKNNTKKLQTKTQELQEWMKKDDDPMSCLNTDFHSQLQLQQQQQQQGSSSYNTPSFHVHPDTYNVSTMWGMGSPDYSSDEGVRSEEENENNEYSQRNVPPSLTTGNGFTAANTEPVGGGGGGAVGGSAAAANSAANYTNLSREVSAEGVIPAVNGILSVNNVGTVAGSLNCNASTTSNPPPCNMCRKHSVGSSSSLPAWPVNSRGAAAAPQGTTWTPTCYCYHGRQDENMCSGDDRLASSNVQQPTDNNTNCIVHQLSKLQAQLQHMSETASNASKCNQGGLLMTLPPNSWMPPPSAAGSSNFQPQAPPSVTPPLQTAPLGFTWNSGSNHNFGSAQKQHYGQFLLSSMNQCCQLIWQQQCELASVKEAVHDLQQQQQYTNNNHHHHHQVESSMHYPGEASNTVVEDHCNSRSNLGRCIQSHSLFRNQPATDSPLSALHSSHQPPLVPLPPPHYFCPTYGNNLNPNFQPFRHSSSPIGSFMPSPAGMLNNQVPPGNRANNYWDNFRSYSRQNLLSVRSKCNEGRSASSGPIVAECSSNPNDRYRSGSISGNSSRHSREMHLHWGGVGGNMNASVPTVTAGTSAPSCIGVSGGITSVLTIPQQQPHQQVNSLNMAGYVNTDQIITHSTPSHKEKLNTYQHQMPAVTIPRFVNNSQAAPTRSPVTDLHQQRQKQPLISAVGGIDKTVTRDSASSFKCCTSKGACKKSPKSKEPSHGLENRNTISLCEEPNSSACNISNTTANVINNNPNNNNSGTYFHNYSNAFVSSNRLLNNGDGGNGVVHGSASGIHGDYSSFELNPIYNRQTQQPTTLQGNSSIPIPEDLPRNSNCKRKLMSSSTSSSAATANNISNTCHKINSSSGTSSIRMESTDLLLDSLEESMYTEVAALISVNEQRPSYLLQLFKDLKQINSDHDMQAVLLTIHDLATKSIAAANNIANFTPSHRQTVPTDQQARASDNEMSLKDGEAVNEHFKKAPEQLNTANGNNANNAGAASVDGRQQPCNMPWRCSKDSVVLAASSVLPSNCRKLDWEVRSILVDMLPFLKSHLSETCTLSLLESVRSLVLQLVPSPQNVPGQLDALLEDALFKFQGCRMYNVCDELISVVADVLISELTFLRLATSVNSSAPVVRDENHFCAAKGKDEVLPVGVEGEGACGGINRPNNNCLLKPRSDNQHKKTAASEISICSTKSDPVVSDAELAEADQSGRLSGNMNCTIGLPLAVGSATVTEDERLSAASNRMTDNKDQNGHSEIVDNRTYSPIDVQLPDGQRTSNRTVTYENSCSDAVESNNVNHQPLRKNILNPTLPSSAVAVANVTQNIVDIWAVEEDREQQSDCAPTYFNLVNGTEISGACDNSFNNDNMPVNLFSPGNKPTTSTDGSSSGGAV